MSFLKLAARRPLIDFGSDVRGSHVRERNVLIVYRYFFNVNHDSLSAVLFSPPCNISK